MAAPRSRCCALNEAHREIDRPYVLRERADGDVIHAGRSRSPRAHPRSRCPRPRAPCAGPRCALRSSTARWTSAIAKSSSMIRSVSVPRLQADLLLLPDHPFDLAIFDVLQLRGCHFTFGALLTLPFSTRRGATGCRHGRRGTAVWYVAFIDSPQVYVASKKSAPDFFRNFYNHPQFRPLLVFGEDIAFFGGGEPALRGQAS